MKLNLQELTLKVGSATTSPALPNYRPPSWPPPRDWPVVIDKEGAIVTRWGDPIWDLSPWEGRPFQLNFGDGEKAGRGEGLDRENADLLRLVVTWLAWGPRGAGKGTTLRSHVTKAKSVIAVCSRNGISAASLTRFPKVLELVPGALAPSSYEATIALLHRALLHK
ncbi:hypothetical protein [Caldimonas tepidiphila]|uniref:hypothetical protein n=1 Tax=Caldimonas tepidiphila TaxID=2315841 RepID=UPI001300AB21|nr:hypothetical protein [Caldimonas tepidiphila]